MATEIRLPKLGQTMEEGTIVNCLVKVGDHVKKGDMIFEIETDKATLEMESPVEGFVKYILVKNDQSLTVGEPMMVLGSKDEIVPQSFIDSLTVGTFKPKKVQAEEPIELGVIPVIMEAEKKPAPSPMTSEGPIKLGQTIPLTRLQKITAERMLKSKREIPCFYLTVKADVTNMVELRDRLNQGGEVKYSYNDFIIKAIATGLEKYPFMMGQIDGDVIRLHDSINIGLAISVPDGLVAPILKDLNKKNIKQISNDSKVLIDKARSNRLAPSDLEGGCITVSNLGAFGIDNFIPIVVPGQGSILGVGKITDTCVPDNGNILMRKSMNMTLSVDHKVVNGAYAAQFLDFVHKLLEDVSTFGLD
jgi:pyruvate dehydrogenase E2 component (dihydrolipoamide acetyltransferase)